MIFLDTGYLLALVHPRDALYARAQAWASLVNERLVVTEYVLWEVVNALSMPSDRGKALAIVDRLRSAPDTEVIHASIAWFDSGLELHARCSDKEWSLTDCISFCVMRTHGIALALTHDHHYEQAGFEALLRNEPPM